LKTASDANTEQFKHDSGVLIQRLKRDHGGCLSALACLYYLTREYLQRLQVEHGKDMRPIIDILTQSMGYWSIANGYTRAQCQAALDDVEQTMLTTAHLAVCSRDIPDNISLNHLIQLASKKATRASLRGR
jgi:hypothetical protein